MSFFGLGRLVYVIVLITNSIAILSEDRFLARIGWGRQNDPSFGAAYDNTSVKAKTINLIASVRTVMRSTFFPLEYILASFSNSALAPTLVEGLESVAPARTCGC
ncbi:Yos1-like-domain-containing protein [Aspergillus filifer]